MATKAQKAAAKAQNTSPATTTAATTKKPVAAVTAAPTPTVAVATPAPTAPAASTTPVAPSVPLFGTSGAPKAASFKAGHNQLMWQGISTALQASPAGLTVAQIQAITSPNMGFANYCIKKCGVLVQQVPAAATTVTPK